MLKRLGIVKSKNKGYDTFMKYVKQKIHNGYVMDINNAILATSAEFDEFVEKLKIKQFMTPEKIEIIRCTRIITEDKVAVEKAALGL